MITSKAKAEKAVEDCLDEMYRSSVPPITWNEILQKYAGKKDWHMKHRISEEDYTLIKEKYQRKLHKMYHRDLDWMLLDYSPRFQD